MTDMFMPHGSLFHMYHVDHFPLDFNYSAFESRTVSNTPTSSFRLLHAVTSLSFTGGDPGSSSEQPQIREPSRILGFINIRDCQWPVAKVSK
jgi:hypothetical protein